MTDAVGIHRRNSLEDVVIHTIPEDLPSATLQVPSFTPMRERSIRERFSAKSRWVVGGQVVGLGAGACFLWFLYQNYNPQAFQHVDPRDPMTPNWRQALSILGEVASVGCIALASRVSTLLPFKSYEESVKDAQGYVQEAQRQVSVFQEECRKANEVVSRLESDRGRFAQGQAHLHQTVDNLFSAMKQEAPAAADLSTKIAQLTATFQSFGPQLAELLAAQRGAAADGTRRDEANRTEGEAIDALRTERTRLEDVNEALLAQLQQLKQSPLEEKEGTEAITREIEAMQTQGEGLEEANRSLNGDLATLHTIIQDRSGLNRSLHSALEKCQQLLQTLHTQPVHDTPPQKGAQEAFRSLAVEIVHALTERVRALQRQSAASLQAAESARATIELLRGEKVALEKDLLQIKEEFSSTLEGIEKLQRVQKKLIDQIQALKARHAEAAGIGRVV